MCPDSNAYIRAVFACACAHSNAKMCFTHITSLLSVEAEKHKPKKKFKTGYGQTLCYFVVIILVQHITLHLRLKGLFTAEAQRAIHQYTNQALNFTSLHSIILPRSSSSSQNCHSLSPTCSVDPTAQHRWA